MTVLIRKNSAVNYILESDRNRPKKQQAIFKLRRLNDEECFALMNRTEQIEADPISNIEFVNDTLKSCVVGWENIKDQNNNVVEFDPDLSIELCLNEKLELFNKIFVISVPDGLTEKNS